jgi:hypothetical protein
MGDFTQSVRAHELRASPVFLVRAPLVVSLALLSCAQGAAGSPPSGDDSEAPPSDAASDTNIADTSRPPSKDAAPADVSVADTAGGDEASEASSDGTTSAEGGTDATTPTEAGGSEAGTDAGRDAVAEASTDGGLDAAADGTSECSCGVQSVCVTGTCVPARRVFVTSHTYDGKLGGHVGADATCQSLAMSAGLGGTWMAWISDSGSSPNRRFIKATVAYRLLDGTLVAATWTALASGNKLSAAIDRDQTGASLAGASTEAAKTWTATATDGTSDTDSCTQFTSNASGGSGEIGRLTSVDNTWTVASSAEACSAAHHLYCFEQ